MSYSGISVLPTPIRCLKTIFWPDRYQSSGGRLTSVPPQNRSLVMLNCHSLIPCFFPENFYTLICCCSFPLKLLRIPISVILYLQFYLSYLAWLYSTGPLTALSHLAICLAVRVKLTQLAVSELYFGSLGTSCSGGGGSGLQEWLGRGRLTTMPV